MSALALIHNNSAMSEPSLHLTTPDNAKVRLTHDSNTLTIYIENPHQLQVYRGVYSYDQLPIEFRVLFENLEEFYDFACSASFRVHNKTLFVPINILSKTKEFPLPLEEVQLTGEWRLRKDMIDLEAKMAAKEQEYGSLLAKLTERDEAVSTLKQRVSELEALAEEKERENLKLANRIRHLENNIEDLLNEKPTTEINQTESKLTEEYTPAKKTHGGKAKKVKEVDSYGKRIVFKVDERAKHFGKFRMMLNEVEKLHGPTYQLYHIEPLPREGRFYFDIKILLIRNSNIVVGIISDKNKDEQFSFKKMNSVCYNGYDGSICEQDRQSYVTIKPKEGSRLRTVVDMTLAQVEWYIMGGELERTLIGKATIPASMLKQQLYPYFELYWEGNKVKLNT